MNDSRCSSHSSGGEVNGEDEDDNDEAFDQIPVRDLDPLRGTDAEYDRNSEKKEEKGDAKRSFSLRFLNPLHFSLLVCVCSVTF